MPDTAGSEGLSGHDLQSLVPIALSRQGVDRDCTLHPSRDGTNLE